MVEALVAIAVLTIGVIGPLTLLAGAIANANYAKNQITAFFLAQEAQELVINQRDQNILKGKNSGQSQIDGSPNSDYWLSGGGLRQCVTGGVSVCYIDAYQAVSGANANAGGNFIECPSGKCPYMTLGVDDFYGYQPEGGDVKNTIFKRKIEVIPIAPTSPYTTADEREAVVKITVTWNEKNTSRTLVLNSIIYRY